MKPNDIYKNSYNESMYQVISEYNGKIELKYKSSPPIWINIDSCQDDIYIGNLITHSMLRLITKFVPV